MSKRDAIALLLVCILPCAFAAYEMAGLLFPGWHTVSYYAAHNAGFEGLIIAGFLAWGIGGAWWFLGHIKRGIPK